MTPGMKFLRALLFLPHGNPEQQQKDILSVKESLAKGRAQVRRARENAELASTLNTLANEALTKLDKE